jgi:signal transduction histidine kinase
MSSTTANKLAARPRPALLDLALAAVTFVGSVALLRHGGIGPTSHGTVDLDVLGIVLAAASTIPLIVWRRSPLGVFAITASSGALLAGLGYRLDLLLGPAVALYVVAASREPAFPWTRRTTFTTVGLFAAYLSASAAGRAAFPGSELIHTGLAWAVAWFAGERTRLRREHVAALKERARRAEAGAERERLLAIAEERARIARDLHDSAGHAISVIALRAGSARLRHGDDPKRSFSALEEIEQLARQTVEEIDEIVGTLREGGAATESVEAPPSLSSLDALVARHTAAGLDVTLDASGVKRPLGSAADQAAYRILQEGLTNAARHGAGSARVELAFGDTAVELSVTNPVATNGSSQTGGGHGLIGMQERATLLGGTLDTERSNGEFRVRARIPYGGHRA